MIELTVELWATFAVAMVYRVRARAGFLTYNSAPPCPLLCFRQGTAIACWRVRQLLHIQVDSRDLSRNPDTRRALDLSTDKGADV